MFWLMSLMDYLYGRCRLTVIGDHIVFVTIAVSSVYRQQFRFFILSLFIMTKFEFSESSISTAPKDNTYAR